MYQNEAELEKQVREAAWMSPVVLSCIILFFAAVIWAN